MLKITTPQGGSIEVFDRPNGERFLVMTGPEGKGELRLDAESAAQVGMALQTHPQDGKSFETLQDELHAKYFASGYEAGKRDAIDPSLKP